MNDVRILKGYSENEQKELENAKKFMNCNDLINNITSYRSNTECGSIKDKYDEADRDEQISIIKDILDFCTDKAKFAEQKYYVHLVKDDSFSYFNLGLNGEKTYIGGNPQTGNFQTQFTYDEVVAIDPRLVPFMEEVEDNE